MQPLVPENATYEQLLQLDEQDGGRAAGGIPLAQLDQLTALQTLSTEQLVALGKNDDAECKICIETYSVGDQLRRLVRTPDRESFAADVRTPVVLGSHWTEPSRVFAACSRASTSSTKIASISTSRSAANQIAQFADTSCVVESVLSAITAFCVRQAVPPAAV